MSIAIHFHGGDDPDFVVGVDALLARFKADDIIARHGSDGFDEWIEFDDSNTIIHLNGDGTVCSGGQVELSLASLQEDLARIVPALKAVGFQVSADEEEL